MKNAACGDAAGAEHNSGAAASDSIPHLRARLAHAAETKRSRKAADHLRLARRFIDLAESMLEASLDDRPTPR